MSKRVLLLLCGFAWAAQADRITLRSGKTLTGGQATFADGAARLDGGRRLPRDQIKEIVLEARRPAAAPGAKASAAPKDIQDLLRQARRMQARHPDADGIVLEDDGAFTLNPDGTNTYRYHFRGLVLKDSKKGAWGQAGLYVDDKRERAKLLWARTIRPDGSVVNVDPASARLADLPGSTRFFNRGKVFSWSMPQVEVGSIVEYVYEKVEFDPFDPNMFFPGFYFQSGDPVAHSRMTVTLPPGNRLYWEAKHMPPGKGEPKVEKLKSGTRYVWEVSDMPPLLPEPMMPPRSAVLAHVQCSLFNTWDYLFDWMARFQKRRMVATPLVRQTAEKAAAGAKTLDEKIARLYYFVEQQVRYVSIKGSIGSGWAGHPADLTLRQRYGDCIDKAILFSTMLRCIGVDAEPVILLTNNAGIDDRKLPTMRGNHAICHLEAQGRSFYLDATSSVHRYPSFAAFDHGVKVINALRRRIGYIPTPPPEMNCRTYDLDITLSADGDASVHYRSRYVGDYEAGVRGYYMYTPKRNHRRALSQMLNALSPKARLKRFKLYNTFDISKPFSIEMWFDLPNYVVKAGRLRIFAPPGEEKRFPEAALPSRRYDIVYRTSLKTVRRITLHAPPGYRVKYLPPPVRLQTRYASYEARYKRLDDSTLQFVSIFRRPARVAPASDYPTYRKFLHDVSRASKKQVFFEVKEGRQP